jgi:heparan-alpha-glucosaminide N-acetyltransferase
LSTAAASGPPHISTDGAGESIVTRIQSIDIFRGITLAVMIFVNDLDGTKNLPWWTFHAKANWDVMTYVDMVFPVFLFLVGMSLPIAINARLRKNPSQLALWGHVIVRSGSLVVLGLILANGDNADPAHMIISPHLWEFLGVLGCGFFLSVYPGKGGSPGWHKALRVLGAVMVITMYALFRRVGPDGQVHWIDGSYPEILGLIGYAYFAVCLLYIPFRRWLIAPLLWFLALVVFNAATTRPFIAMVATHSATAAHWLSFEHGLRGYQWPWGNGSSACLIMAGIVTTVIFMGPNLMETKRFQTFRQKLVPALAFSVVALSAGYLLQPLGISKIRATPTWCLYTIAFAVAAFTLLYWICDIRKTTGWAFAFRPAGSNTLTTYLLPDYWEMLGAVGISFFGNHFRYGWQGVVKSILFTCLMLAIATFLTRRKVRLAL